MKPTAEAQEHRFHRSFPVVILFLGIVLFLGNYLFLPCFVLYDDDFIFTLPAFSWTRAEAFARILNSFRAWPQGRPVGFAGADLISYLSAQSGGLTFGYVLGYLFLLLNGVLIYCLAKRFVPPYAAVMAAAVYLLYPVDNSKIILMHRVFAHANIACLLFSLLCYVRGQRYAGYLFAPISFLIYEPVAVLYLLAPLLVTKRRDFSWRRLLVHGAIVAALLGAILLYRGSLGDARVGETFAKPGEIIQRSLTAMWMGPWVSLSGLVARPFDALRYSDGFQWLVIVLVAGLFYQIFSRGAPHQPSDESGVVRTSEIEPSLILFVVGALGFALGYCLMFRDDYFPPITTLGRMSVLHSTGSVGCSLLVGGLVGAIGSVFKRQRRLWIVIAAVFCGLLVSLGLEIQKIDYVRHAEQQRALWRTIMATSGEWTDDTAILVDISGTDSSRPTTPGMPLWWMVNYAPLALDHMVDWPTSKTMRGGKLDGPTAAHHPRVCGYVPDYFPTEVTPDGILIKSPQYLGPTYWPLVKNGNFLYFRFTNGRMERVTESVTIAAKTLTPLGPNERPGPSLPTSAVYRMLFEPRTTWPSISGAKNYPR